MVKGPPGQHGDTGDGGLILSREHLLEEEMAIHSSVLVWEVLWTEEPDRPQSVGSERVTND